MKREIFNYHSHYSETFYPKEQLVSGDLTAKQSLYFIERRQEIAKAIVRMIALKFSLGFVSSKET